MLSAYGRAVRQLLSGVSREWKKPLASKYCSVAAEVEKDLPAPPEPAIVQPKGKCPVDVYNEWDPLEEVLLGRPDGAIVPNIRPEIQAGVRPDAWPYIRDNAGQPFEPETVKLAIDEVNELQRILELEGVTVRRPEMIKWTEQGEMRTPDFTEPGFAMAYPRDCITAIGNEIIEATMSWRCRYFETRPWKKTLTEYFKQGAKWTLAPKPTMTDALYDPAYPYEDTEARDKLASKGIYQLTEVEPAFDAADIFRCGKDIFIQISTTTNWGGAEWLRRHLAPNFRVHPLNLVDGGALHIDASFIPMRPGLIFANPERPCLQVDFFRQNGWDVVYAPKPVSIASNMFYASHWLSLNVLHLDEERVVCYKYETGMQELLKKYGFKPIGVDLEHSFHLGGAFHCWTADIRRKGELKSYFDKFDVFRPY